VNMPNKGDPEYDPTYGGTAKGDRELIAEIRGLRADMREGTDKMSREYARAAAMGAR
jgi:hypothetical protein